MAHPAQGSAGMGREIQGKKMKRKFSKPKQKDFIFDLLGQWPEGRTEQQLAKALNTGRRNINNYLHELRAEGRVEKQGRKWTAVKGRWVFVADQ